MGVEELCQWAREPARIGDGSMQRLKVDSIGSECGRGGACMRSDHRWQGGWNR